MTCSVLALCPSCDRPVKVEARGYVQGKRQQKWLVLKHPALGDDSGGRDCDGVGRFV